MLSETPEKEANLSIEFEAKEVNDAIGMLSCYIYRLVTKFE